MLQQMKVLSFCHYLQGPAAGQYLGDLGAEVIKVEPLDGAYERHWSGANVYVGGVSGFFLSANRNKRSIAIDLKSPRGRDIVFRLVDRADVVIENFRPGVLDRLGLGYEALRSRKPALIYASATGFGAGGPLRDRPGQDLLIQARAGLIAACGDRFAAPTPVGFAVVDQHGGALLALGVLAAYVKLLLTGQGTRVESSLFNAGIDLQVEAITNFLNGAFQRTQYKRDPHLATWFHEAPYGVYKAADGFVAISLNDPRKLAKALDETELARFAEIDRYKQRDAYARAIAAAVSSRTVEDLSRRFDAEGIWYAPVQDYEDLKRDPQALHNQVFREVDVNGTTATLINHPVRYDGEAPDVRHLALAPGQDTRNILVGLGLSETEIDSLIAARIIAVPAGAAKTVDDRAEVAQQ